MTNKENSRVTAKYTTSKIVLDGRLDEEIWAQTQTVRIEQVIKTGKTVPALSTEVRVLWTADFLYIAYVAPYRELVTFEPAIFEGKRVGLWERDVVEVFINPNPNKINHYSEYEVAPTGEKIDLMLDLPNKDFLWNSHFEAAVHLDATKQLWTTEMRIPFSAFEVAKPSAGTCWRINFYRHAIAERVFLGWQPTMNDSAHKPEYFGILEFLQ
ncbi:MAG: carbohydrate-binding family 9-like protein [Planctomycetaceae bacterium]|nr:carbohydrate-binding family 9-like protein [Planctomycetaceae bacterium]